MPCRGGWKSTEDKEEVAWTWERLKGRPEHQSPQEANQQDKEVTGLTPGHNGKDRCQDGTGMKEEEKSKQEERRSWDTWQKEKERAKEDSAGYVDRQDTSRENARTKERAKAKG